MRLASWVMDAVSISIKTAIDSGGAPAYIEVFDGEPPEAIDGSYGNLLSKSIFGFPGLGNPVNGFMSISTPLVDPLTLGYGIPKSYRIRTSTDVTVMDGPVGEEGVLDSGDVFVEGNLIQQSAKFNWQTGSFKIGNRG